jgi:hypothetical protein
MVERNEILSKIEEMIHLLTNPLDDSEIKNGWDPALQARWKIYYQKMHEYLKAGKPLLKKPEYTASIVRAYDFSGIMQGKLFDHAINIQCQARQIAEKEKPVFRIFRKLKKLLFTKST